MGLKDGGPGMYEVFGDPRCQRGEDGIVRLNNLRENLDFVSVAYVPPTTARRELGPPSNPVDREQQNILLHLDGHMANGQTLSD